VGQTCRLQRRDERGQWRWRERYENWGWSDSNIKKLVTGAKKVARVLDSHISASRSQVSVPRSRTVFKMSVVSGYSRLASSASARSIGGSDGGSLTSGKGAICSTTGSGSIERGSGGADTTMATSIANAAIFAVVWGCCSVARDKGAWHGWSGRESHASLQSGPS